MSSVSKMALIYEPFSRFPAKIFPRQFDHLDKQSETECTQQSAFTTLLFSVHVMNQSYYTKHKTITNVFWECLHNEYDGKM